MAWVFTSDGNYVNFNGGGNLWRLHKDSACITWHWDQTGDLFFDVYGQEYTVKAANIADVVINGVPLSAASGFPAAIKAVFTGLSPGGDSGLEDVLTVSNDAGGIEIENAADPTGAQSLVTRQYFDDNVPSVPANITTQGNSFNGASQLVQLGGDSKLPAVDGSLLTNLPAPSLGYSVYKALLSQSGSNAPTVIILGSNTIGNIVWTRTGVGVYTGPLNGAFTANKSSVLILPSRDPNEEVAYGAYLPDANRVIVSSTVAVEYGDDLISNLSIVIEVYP